MSNQMEIYDVSPLRHRRRTAIFRKRRIPCHGRRSWFHSDSVTLITRSLSDFRPPRNSALGGHPARAASVGSVGRLVGLINGSATSPRACAPRPLLLVAAATCPVFPPALACLVQARTHAPRPNLLWIEEEENDTPQYFIISLGTSSIDGSGETIDS